jgi:hypothetical protein
VPQPTTLPRVSIRIGRKRKNQNIKNRKKENNDDKKKEKMK